uniref:Uncharacterized protein n=1 Tax=Romanomermis culicivorax TaxID=13658 RepID=A0A915KMM1_ROMCU
MTTESSDDEEPGNCATAGSSDADDPLITRSLKIVVVGDSTSGKTSLCCRLAQDSFGKMYRQTAGLDFYVDHQELQGQTNQLSAMVNEDQCEYMECCP